MALPIRSALGCTQAACLPVPDDDVAGPDLGADPLHQGIEADRIRPLHPGDDAGLPRHQPCHIRGLIPTSR